MNTTMNTHPLRLIEIPKWLRRIVNNIVLVDSVSSV